MRCLKSFRVDLKLLNDRYLLKNFLQLTLFSSRNHRPLIDSGSDHLSHHPLLVVLKFVCYLQYLSCVLAQKDWWVLLRYLCEYHHAFDAYSALSLCEHLQYLWQNFLQVFGLLLRRDFHILTCEDSFI